MQNEETQVSVQEITITPEAAEQIRNIRKENQVPESHGLRIGLQSGGCCGPAYLLAFDEKVTAADCVLQSEGVSIYVDKEDLEYLSGTTLQYVDGPQGKGFKFDNPHQAKSCNCHDGDSGCGCG